MADKIRAKRVKDFSLKLKDPREIEERQKLFNQMDSPFKNRVVRYTEPVY